MATSKPDISAEDLQKTRKLVSEGRVIPRSKVSGSRHYIALRTRGTDKDIYHLPWDQTLFQELKGLVPVQPALPGGGALEGKGVPMAGVMADVGPPRQGRPPIPNAEDWREWAVRFGIGTDILMFWEYSVQHGYTSGLGAFMNDCIRVLMDDYGLELAVIKREDLREETVKPNDGGTEEKHSNSS